MAETELKELESLKAKAQEGKVVIGMKQVLQGITKKSLQKVYLAANCPKKMKEDVQHYARLAQIPVREVPQSNEDLGIVCKKNFLIAVVGVKGE